MALIINISTNPNQPDRLVCTNRNKFTNTIRHSLVSLPVFRMLSAIHLSHFSPSSSSLRTDFERSPALIVRPVRDCTLGVGSKFNRTSSAPLSLATPFNLCTTKIVEWWGLGPLDVYTCIHSSCHVPRPPRMRRLAEV